MPFLSRRYEDPVPTTPEKLAYTLSKDAARHPKATRGGSRTGSGEEPLCWVMMRKHGLTVDPVCSEGYLQLW